MNDIKNVKYNFTIEQEMLNLFIMAENLHPFQVQKYGIFYLFFTMKDPENINIFKSNINLLKPENFGGHIVCAKFIQRNKGFI